MAESADAMNNNFQQLFTDAKEYIKLQADYLRVQSVEKLTIFISTILFIFILIIFLLGALFYLFFTLAYAIAPLVGGLAVSFGIVTGLHLALIGLLALFRKKLIVNPLLNFLIKLFYNKETEIKEDGNIPE